jgi:hypothetical protein
MKNLMFSEKSQEKTMSFLFLQKYVYALDVHRPSPFPLDRIHPFLITVRIGVNIQIKEGNMQQKTSILIIAIVVSLSSMAFAQNNWEARKATWEPLVTDKANIAMMAGGDLNGDYVDDIAIIYRGGPNQGLVVLISDRTEYKKYPFQGNRLDLIYNTELAQAQTMWVRNGNLEILCPFKGKKLLSDVASNENATVTFKFFENTIKLTDIVFNATLEQKKSLAQVWFDANIGRVFLEYLGEKETVGGKRFYYFRYYYRLAAYQLNNVKIDGEDHEWVIFSYPVYLKNSPVGNPITYGFEKWKSDFDISGKIYAGYDQENVYFLIEVYDDVFNQTFSGDKMLRGDHIELWFANGSGYKVQIGICDTVPSVTGRL